MNDTAVAIGINYGTGVVTVPAAAADKLPSASPDEIRVLFAVLTSPGVTPDGLADKLPGIDSSAINSALAFWRGAGILTGADVPVKNANNDPEKNDVGDNGKKSSVLMSSELGDYTSDEISQMVEDDPDLSKMIDECQRILGRMFRVSETGKLLAFVDQLGFTPEYVLCLCAHCAKKKKTTLRYIEGAAVGLHDDGIDTVEKLEAHLSREEKLDSALPLMCELFDIEGRALTNKEKRNFRTWRLTYNYSDDVIRRACEVAADAKGKATVSYVNGIIENWYSGGLLTAEDVESHIRAEKGEKDNSAGKSFDVDDFFAAALRRTYGDSEFIPDVTVTGTDKNTSKKTKKRQ